jgi:hypothetical protein
LESLAVLIAYIENYGEDISVEWPSDTTITATFFPPNNSAFEELFDITGILTWEDISNFASSLGASDAEAAEYLAYLLELHTIMNQKLYKADIRDDADGVIGPTDMAIEVGEEEVGVNLLVTIVVETITRTPEIPDSTGADIDTADFESLNGIAHIINAVMWPPLD